MNKKQANLNGIIIIVIDAIVLIDVIALVIGTKIGSIEITANWFIAVSLVILVCAAQIFYFSYYPKLKYKKYFDVAKQKDYQKLSEMVLSKEFFANYEDQYFLVLMLDHLLECDSDTFEAAANKIVLDKFQCAKYYYLIIHALKNKNENLVQSYYTEYKNSIKTGYNKQIYVEVLSYLIENKELILTQRLLKKVKNQTIKNLIEAKNNKIEKTENN